jgi:iron complex transport system ATP-binding protein
MDNIIRLENIDFRYRAGDPPVIRNLSLDIPGGRVSAILGPNGTGKTTLLHIMLGLLKPKAGTVRIDGRTPAEYTRRELSRTIGLVPQFESIPFNLTVFEYLLLGRSPYLKPFQMPGEEDEAIVRRAVASVGIEHLAKKPAQRLSGGERQLVHIARVLVQKPQVLLLDEPTAHLDLENQHRILGMLKEMSRQGLTTVFTTHDPNAAIHTADHFILMQGGRIVEQGDLETVITAENLAAIYRIPLRVESANGYTLVVMEKAR